MKCQYIRAEYFNTVNTIQLIEAPSGLAEQQLSLCARFEKLFSRTIEGSDVWNINHSGGMPVRVSEDTARCISIGLEVSERSYGSFDMSIGALKGLWCFSKGRERVADAQELERALSCERWIKVRGDTVQISPGAEIDLGGIAKGYIADRLEQCVQEAGCAGALINLGGNIYASGCSVHGDLWKIGIKDPVTDMAAAVLETTDVSIVTSSFAEQHFERAGTLYHHIFDPATGHPSASGLRSVTVASSCSAIADAAATAAFVLGEEKAMRFLRTMENVEYLLITQNGEVVKSDGLPCK